MKPVILCLASALSLGTTALAQETIRERFPVNLGDFETQAELSYPAAETGPLPTVLLIHGSTPMDMDASVFSVSATGEPVLLSAIFKDIADHLNENGFAVVRYNKHYVTGPGQADYAAYYTDIDLPQLLEDAEKVLAATVTRPEVDDEHVYVYGWSEGSTVAASLAATDPNVAGLIVQGPVVSTWRETFEAQVTEAGIPYTRRFAPDGRVTAEVLAQMQAGDGGLVAKGIVSYLADASFFQTGKVKVSAPLDTNNDGVIELEREFVRSGFDQTLDFLLGPQGPLNIYSEQQALPTLLTQADALKLPVLILQGANDASTPVAGAEQLAGVLETAGRAVTLKIYDDLGHSLGETPSIVADNFQPIAPTPLVDLAAWLREQDTNQ